MPVKFEDNSIRVKAELNAKTLAWLYEAAGELEAQTRRNTRVDTGQLKNSWNYTVDESTGEATIGSPLENAIWEEFGTGQYALHGDGRKTEWTYKDREGNWHKTVGKKPNRTLEKSFTSLKLKLKSMLEQVLKGMGS